MRRSESALGQDGRVVECWERLEPPLLDGVSGDITDRWRLWAAAPVNGATEQQMSDVAVSNGKQAWGRNSGGKKSVQYSIQKGSDILKVPCSAKSYWPKTSVKISPLWPVSELNLEMRIVPLLFLTLVPHFRKLEIRPYWCHKGHWYIYQ